MYPRFWIQKGRQAQSHRHANCPNTRRVGAYTHARAAFLSLSLSDIRLFSAGTRHDKTKCLRYENYFITLDSCVTIAKQQLTLLTMYIEEERQRNIERNRELLAQFNLQEARDALYDSIPSMSAKPDPVKYVIQREKKEGRFFRFSNIFFSLFFFAIWKYRISVKTRKTIGNDI